MDAQIYGAHLRLPPFLQQPLTLRVVHAGQRAADLGLSGGDGSPRIIFNFLVDMTVNIVYLEISVNLNFQGEANARRISYY